MRIKLPQNKIENSISLESAIKQRKTKREFLGTPISLNNLSRHFFAAQGMRGSGKKRVAPSAQEQYPISTFVVVNNLVENENFESKVSDISSGLY